MRLDSMLQHKPWGLGISEIMRCGNLGPDRDQLRRRRECMADWGLRRGSSGEANGKYMSLWGVLIVHISVTLMVG